MLAIRKKAVRLHNPNYNEYRDVYNCKIDGRFPSAPTTSPLVLISWVPLFQVHDTFFHVRTVGFHRFGRGGGGGGGGGGGWEGGGGPPFFF